MTDFNAVYYGARCVIQHSDPYKAGEFLRVYQADGGEIPSDPKIFNMFRRAVPVCINLPTSLFLIAPFTVLAWGPAHVLWMILEAGSLIFAALLTWNLAGNHASGISLFLICIILANSEGLFQSGNLAGIAISLCVVAVWCFLNERFVSAGILCLAVSLVLKPHDTGLVWLYFLLAGALYRRRALQTLVVVLVLCLPAILWVSHVAPHWIQELHSNLQATSAHGDLNDPGPASLSGQSSTVSIIDLQSVISVFRDDPRIYNPASYLVCGALLLVWSLKTLRARFTTASTWLALAAIAPLTLLVTYHRPYDTKLLLLTVPACAILWAEGGPIGWIALAVNTVGIVFTGDVPLAILVILTKNLHAGTGLPGKMLTVALTRPVPLVLLAMGIFYLWVYVRRAPARAATTEHEGSEDSTSRYLRCIPWRN